MLEIINILFSSIAFTISVYMFGVIVLSDKHKKENKVLYNAIIIIFSIILYALIFLLFKGIIKTILHCLSLMIIFKFIFKVDLGKSLISAIIYSIVCMISDLLVLGFLTGLFKISKDVFHVEYAGGLIGTVFVSSTTILLEYFLKHPLRKILNLKFTISKKIIIVSCMTLISLIIFFYHLINTFRLDRDIIGYLVVISTLIVILFYFFKQKIDNDLILRKYDELLNIMKTYENDIEEQRTMIHETRNELTTIKCKIEDKSKNKEIIEYIDSILDDKTSSNMSKYSKFKYLPSNGIKGFFYYKFMEAEKKNIKVSVNISKKIEDSFFKDLDTKVFKDLVRIIGVYLDNAIEASYDSEERKLGIEIYLIKSDIEIIISNTFDNEINMDKIGKEKFTTKGKNHGHGLLLVKHILNNNTIFQANKEILNNLYVQKLRIKNSDKTNNL